MLPKVVDNLQGKVKTPKIIPIYGTLARYRNETVWITKIINCWILIDYYINCNDTIQ